MTDDSSNKKTSDMARRIWLAGIGAYGKAFEEGRAQLEKLSDASGGLFDQLAEKGEKLETAAKLQGMKLAGKASEVREDLGVEDRITAMRERLTGAVPSLGGASEARMDAMEAKLSSIEEKLDALLKAQASPKRATTTKTTARKKAPAKKAPAKEAAAKKAPAKNAPAKKTSDKS